MKKLAIVSSYSDLCGNASYTESLCREFAKYYDVEIFALNSHINKLHAGAAKKRLGEMAKQLKKFDLVNIQFEGGLYGNDPKTIYQNFKQLAKASKNLIVTLHRYDPKLTFAIKSVFLEFVRYGKRDAWQNIKKNLRENAYRNFENVALKVVEYCKKNKIAIIVHTERDKLLIQSTHNYQNVYGHPLSFLPKETIDAYKMNVSKPDFLKKYALTEKNVCIGIFGFISRYKGHDTMLKALNYLPDNHVALIFGTQHPLSIMQYTDTDPYLAELITLVRGDKKNSLKERVRFCGSLGNDDFINALLCCDFTVLPYLEVNQGGSGIASLALEMGTKAIFSQNLAFLELAKYAPNCFEMFSIGNYLELADTIRHYVEDNSLALDNYYKNYNIHTSIRLYRDIFENHLDKKRDARMLAG
ncbi:MAG: hypothetical protein WBE18_00530 [Gammaproteobacteria bacterium]